MSPFRMRRCTLPAQLAVLLVVAQLLSACTWISQLPPTPVPGEVELSFESLDRNPGYPPVASSKLEPVVALVTSVDEIEERLDQMVRDSTLERLQDVDFGQDFVLAVFRGIQGEGGYSVTIRRVARRGEQLVVYAEFGERSPSFPKPAILVAPYHVITVQRDGGPLEQGDVILLTWLTYTQ